jgi:two-component system, response regulator PdtaR
MTSILVVEDEPSIRMVISEAISDVGYTIVAAASADEAIGLLDASHLRLIVTDINLPGRLDGIDLAVAARRRFPGLGVIFISGRPSKLVEAQLLSDPAAFFQKPFRLMDLTDDVQRLAGAP